MLLWLDPLSQVLYLLKGLEPEQAVLMPVVFGMFDRHVCWSVQMTQNELSPQTSSRVPRLLQICSSC